MAMQAVLYAPQQTPQTVSIDGMALPDPATGLVRVPEQVPRLLDCAPTLVDVLASAPNYIVYAVFDHDGQVNHAAMEALTKLTGASFGENEDSILRGAVLIIQA
ncbi:MAG: hypothetical protein EOO61_04310 [Hymenobacter sp.]|nr:MAG: hypothetical protein EOO61_04310 [Hymenobacter sp.]